MIKEGRYTHKDCQGAVKKEPILVDIPYVHPGLLPPTGVFIPHARRPNGRVYRIWDRGPGTSWQPEGGVSEEEAQRLPRHIRSTMEEARLSRLHDQRVVHSSTRILALCP